MVGCGSIGRRHIGNLLGLGVREVAAVDTRADRRDEAAAEFDIPTHARLADAWSGEPTVAVIATPPAAHLEPAMEAVRRGCHLFVEKPLAASLEGTDELADAARAQCLVTLVGCNLRFHPGLRRLHTWLSDGAVGRVVSARLSFGQYLPDWHPWEDYRQGYSARQALGGGVILDAIHEIDYGRWLLGEIEAVSCFAGRLSRLEIDSEDTAAIIVTFASGALGEIHLDYVQRPYGRTCQIIGDEGTLVWDYVAREVRLYRASTGKWEVSVDPEQWTANEMYVDELRHLLSCLAGEAEPLVDIVEGRRVLEIALAARESARDGGRPVRFHAGIPS